MSTVDERLADLGVGPGSTETLTLDSLSRFELWILLEEVAGRDVPIEMIMSIETSHDVHCWIDQLRSRP